MFENDLREWEVFFIIVRKLCDRIYGRCDVRCMYGPFFRNLENSVILFDSKLIMPTPTLSFHFSHFQNLC